MEVWKYSVPRWPKHALLTDGQLSRYIRCGHFEVIDCIVLLEWCIKYNYFGPYESCAPPTHTHTREKRAQVEEYQNYTLSVEMFLCVSPHLLNGNMFALIVQPDRHLRGETELPERVTGEKQGQHKCQHKSIFFLFRPYVPGGIRCYVPKVDRLVRRGGGAGRGRALLTVSCFNWSWEVRSKSTSWYRLLWQLLGRVGLHWKCDDGNISRR